MKKEKYIQLPPIPEDMDGRTVRMIWEYAKLPKSHSLSYLGTSQLL